MGQHAVSAIRSARRHRAVVLVAVVTAAITAGGPALAGAVNHGSANPADHQPNTFRITQQRGWLVQYGFPGEVQTYENLQFLVGGSSYYLNLTTPNVVRGQAFYLAGITVCYDADVTGDKIDTTHVLRSSNGNYVDVDYVDDTDHGVVFPDTECYPEIVNDVDAPPYSTYVVELDTVGGIRVIRVTANYVTGALAHPARRTVSIVRRGSVPGANPRA